MHAWKGSHIIVTPVGNSHDRLDLDPGIIWKKEHPEISGTAKFGGKLLQIEEKYSFLKYASFVYICTTHENAYHKPIPCVIQIYTKFEGLYFLLFTTFRHQTLQFY